jgi:hypothetical protein
MLWMASVMLFVFWLSSISDSFTWGGYVHILLGLSLVVVVIQIIRDRRDLARAKRRWCSKLHGQKEICGESRTA